MIYKLLFLLVALKANLICNGDFESFTVSNYNSEYGYFYSEQSSDPNCWYNTRENSFDVKRVGSYPTTLGAQLTTSQPSILCQDILLAINSSYELQYDVFSLFDMKNMVFTVELNNVSIDSCFIAWEAQFGNSSVTFIAQKVLNTLCFSQVHGYIGTQNPNLGGIIDNVTLIEIFDSPVENVEDVENHEVFVYQPKINEKVVHIYFDIAIEELLGKISLNSYFSVLNYPWIINHFAKHCLISINQESQKSISFYANSENYLCVDINLNQSYELQKIAMTISDYEQPNENISFQLYINGNDGSYINLGQDQIQIISAIKPIAEKLSSFIYTLYGVMSSTFCSILILSLFTFWNLSLLYMFLLIDTFPDFSKKIYQLMLGLLTEKGSILNWIYNDFGVQKRYLMFQDISQIREQISELIQRHIWLGSFGFSSKFFQNNIDSFIVLALLILKIGLIKLIIRLIPRNIKQKSSLSINFTLIFLAQVISATPFIIISATASMRQSLITVQQKGQKSAQIIIFFICIVVLPIWISIRLKLQKNRIKNSKKQLKNLNIPIGQNLQGKKFLMIKKMQLQTDISKIHKQVRQDRLAIHDSAYQFYLCLSIPTLIMLQETGLFLIINSLIIFIRAVRFFKTAKRMKKLDIAIGFSMTFIWVVHNFVFILLYVINAIEKNQGEIIKSLGQIKILLGIISLVTVLSGGIVQIIKVFIDFAAIFIAIGKQIKKIFCEKKRTSNAIEPENNEQKKSYIIPEQPTIEHGKPIALTFFGKKNKDKSSIKKDKKNKKATKRLKADQEAIKNQKKIKNRITYLINIKYSHQMQGVILQSNQQQTVQ